MKIDYEFSEKLGNLAAKTLMDELIKQTKGKQMWVSTNEFVGMYVTATLVFIDHIMTFIQADVKADRETLAKEFILGINYSFLTNKDALH